MHNPLNATFPIGVTDDNNPVTDSLYAFNDEPLIAPGPPLFVITDGGLYVTTDDGRFVTTG